MRTPRLLAATLLSAGLCFAVAAPAQAQRPDRAAQIQKRMQQARARLLRLKVGLDEKKASEVERILDQHSKERKTLQKEIREQRRNVTKLLVEDSNDQKAYSQALGALRSADQKLRTLRDRELDALAKILTPKQQAKLIVAVKQMQKEVRSRMKRRKGGSRD